jgi:choline-sulfatase
MPERPNVLFFFPDQHRHDFVGFDGDVPVRTPNLDALASEGVAFRNAVCPSPVCGPSRACLASGTEYDRCGVRDHSADYPYAADTYFERLRDDAGYHVLGTGKFDLQKHSGDWGVDGRNNLAANGFSDGVNCAGKWDCVGSVADRDTDPWGVGEPADPYAAHLAAHDLLATHVRDFQRRAESSAQGGPTFPTDLPEHAYCDNWIARRGLDLLDEAPADRPWHLVLNFAGPHNPWDVTEEMHGWYRDPDVTFPEPVEPGDLEPEQAQEIRRNYAAMVENLDRWLGRYRERLAERGEWENTLVVFASDHGEMLGDHGQWYKRSPYHASAGVPLVVAGPGVEARGVVDEPASVLDLHATFRECAGLDPGDGDSRSLWPYLSGATDGHRDVVHSGVGSWRMAFDGRFKLVRGYGPDGDAGDGDPWNEASTKRALREADPLLFDRRADPDETRNAAADHPDVVERLTAEIREVRGER